MRFLIENEASTLSIGSIPGVGRVQDDDLPY